MSNNKKFASVLLWTTQCGRIYSERYGNQDDYIQFNHKIWVTEFWKRSLRGRKTVLQPAQSASEGNITLSNIQWLRDARKNVWPVSNISLAAKGGQMERWPLPGAAVGTSFCSMWCCPGQAGTGACHWSCLAALGASQKRSVALTTSCHLGRGPGWNRESKPCELDNASDAIVKLPSLMS